MEDNLNADDALRVFLGRFEASEEASAQGRAEAEKARDYFDGRQLTPAELAALKKRRQPPVVINRIKRKINYLRGLERQSRTDPQARPRTKVHEEEAEAATDALRYVAQDQRFDTKRSQVWDNMLVEGYGGVEVGVKQSRRGIDVSIVRIAWDRLFFDPHSAEPDFSDAQYLGYVTWMDLAEAKRQWPDAGDILDSTMARPFSGTYGDTYDDKPKWRVWADTKRKRVRIVQIYVREGGQWLSAIFTLAGFLQKPQPTGYLNEDGEHECPLILQSAYVDRDNDRYGEVRDLISPQDEVNKRRSKALHLLNMRQSRVSRRAQKSPAEIRAELAKPDGVIQAEVDEFDILPTGDMATGQFQLLQEAKTELDLMGPNATMAGKGEGEGKSGRAILALQQGGMVEMSPLLDGLRDFSIRVFRAVWNRIRQYWTEERWIRVTDDEKNVRFVGLNRPVTMAEQAEQKIRAALEAGQIDEQTAQQYMAQVQADPEMQQVVSHENVVAELDVDIEIDEINETPSLQIEQFEQLTMLAASGVPIPPDVIIEASNLRNKRKLLERLEQAQQGPSPEQQAMQQLQIADAEAKVAKTRSETEKNLAQAGQQAQQTALQSVAVVAPELPPMPL